MIRINDATTLKDADVEERFVRAFGPRGQNARRKATAVELRVDLATASLPADVKARLRALAARQLRSDRVRVIVSRAYRSQAENRDAAHARLVSLLQRATIAPRVRRPTRPRREVRERRLAAKHRHAAVKASRCGCRTSVNRRLAVRSWRVYG